MIFDQQLATDLYSIPIENSMVVSSKDITLDHQSWSLSQMVCLKNTTCIKIASCYFTPMFSIIKTGVHILSCMIPTNERYTLKAVQAF